MTKLTKADIDELVAKIGRVTGSRDTLFDYSAESNDGVWAARLEVKAWDVARALYLAAGLTAEGAPKPEKKHIWMVRKGGWTYYVEDLSMFAGDIVTAIPGTFVPDP